MRGVHGPLIEWLVEAMEYEDSEYPVDIQQGMTVVGKQTDPGVVTLPVDAKVLV